MRDLRGKRGIEGAIHHGGKWCVVYSGFPCGPVEQYGDEARQKLCVSRLEDHRFGSVTNTVKFNSVSPSVIP